MEHPAGVVLTIDQQTPNVSRTSAKYRAGFHPTRRKQYLHNELTRLCFRLTHVYEF